MNDNNNNFSLIRNSEINRLGPKYIMPQFYEKYKVHDKMKELNAYENEDYIKYHSKVWKRTDYEPKYCNKVVNMDYDKQYCILGINTLLLNLDKINKLYENEKNDFILLEHKCDNKHLWSLLDEHKFDRMKCYAMDDCDYVDLERYFLYTYKSCDDFEIININ